MTRPPAEIPVWAQCSCGALMPSLSDALRHAAAGVQNAEAHELRLFVDVVELSAVVRAIAQEERRERARDV